MKKNSFNYELKIDDDYRKSKENLKQRYFFPLNQETNFKINKFFRIISKDKRKTNKTLNIKGRKFQIKEFYDGIVRFTFEELCNKNLGAEDYINIANICHHIFIEEIPIFDDENSNQQLRFITLIDILYEKKIRLTLSLKENLDNLGSSKKHFTIFKRTVSRINEMTKSP